MSKRILLIEDETDVLLSNQELLASAGYEVVTAESLDEGRRLTTRSARAK